MSVGIDKSTLRSEALLLDAIELLLKSYREAEKVERVERTESFACRVRRLRSSLGLTQEGLASAAGLSTMAITHFETGRRKNPGIKTVVALARVLNVSLDDLLGAE